MLMRHHTGARILCPLGFLVGSLALFGCPKQPDVGQAPRPTNPPPEVRVALPPSPALVPEAPARVTPGAIEAATPLKDAFFDFDTSALREDQKAALTEDGAWLKGNAGAKVLIEGHCDERGTAEYNLGLGERRAKAVKDSLITEGVAADRISIISYGKERPFVLGHDESAWKWNRRAHFVLQGQ
jgi:peptidoglycan-associated lipoprotein